MAGVHAQGLGEGSARPVRHAHRIPLAGARVPQQRSQAPVPTSTAAFSAPAAVPAPAFPVPGGGLLALLRQLGRQAVQLGEAGAEGRRVHAGGPGGRRGAARRRRGAVGAELIPPALVDDHQLALRVVELRDGADAVLLQQRVHAALLRAQPLPAHVPLAAAAVVEALQAAADAAAGLQHEHGAALALEQRRGAEAAEPGADDDDVCGHHTDG